MTQAGLRHERIRMHHANLRELLAALDLAGMRWVNGVSLLEKTLSALGNTSNRTRHDVRLKTDSHGQREGGRYATTCAGRAAEAKGRSCPNPVSKAS